MDGLVGAIWTSLLSFWESLNGAKYILSALIAISGWIVAAQVYIQLRRTRRRSAYRDRLSKLIEQLGV